MLLGKASLIKHFLSDPEETKICLAENLKLTLIMSLQTQTQSTLPVKIQIKKKKEKKGSF